MFGRLSEVNDAYQAVAWAVYTQDKNGDIVPALIRMSHRELMQALATNDPDVRLDIIGAIENYALMQLSDLAVAKVAQRADVNALDLGWSKDLGIMSISTVGKRSLEQSVVADQIDRDVETHKEFQDNGLSLSRSLIPILREASGTEIFRRARVSELFPPSE